MAACARFEAESAVETKALRDAHQLCISASSTTNQTRLEQYIKATTESKYCARDLKKSMEHEIQCQRTLATVLSSNHSNKDCAYVHSLACKQQSGETSPEVLRKMYAQVASQFRANGMCDTNESLVSVFRQAALPESRENVRYFLASLQHGVTQRDFLRLQRSMNLIHDEIADLERAGNDLFKTFKFNSEKKETVVPEMSSVADTTTTAPVVLSPRFSPLTAELPTSGEQCSPRNHMIQLIVAFFIWPTGMMLFYAFNSLCTAARKY